MRPHADNGTLGGADDSRVFQGVVVEVLGGPPADVGVHAVLYGQQADGVAAILQPLEEGTLQKALPGSAAQHRGRQLLRVAHQHCPAGISFA